MSVANGIKISGASKRHERGDLATKKRIAKKKVIDPIPEPPPPISRKGKEVAKPPVEKEITGKVVLERLSEIGNVRAIFNEDQIKDQYEKRKQYRNVVRELYNSNQETRQRKTTMIKKQSQEMNLASHWYFSGKRLVQERLGENEKHLDPKTEKPFYDPKTGYCTRCNTQHIPYCGKMTLAYPLVCKKCSKSNDPKIWGTESNIYGISLIGADHNSKGKYNPTDTRGSPQENSTSGLDQFSKLPNCLGCLADECMTSQKPYCCGLQNRKVKKSNLKTIINPDGTTSKTIQQSVSHGTFICQNPFCSACTLSRDSTSAKSIAINAVVTGVSASLFPSSQRRLLYDHSNHSAAFNHAIHELNPLLLPNPNQKKNYESLQKTEDQHIPIHSENAIEKQSLL